MTLAPYPKEMDGLMRMYSRFETCGRNAWFMEECLSSLGADAQEEWNLYKQSLEFLSCDILAFINARKIKLLKE